ncbi:MAG: protein kinase [Polyangiaceae bacterium]|nr:protein kinase [Polyangiaceae bacterium]
MAEPGDSCGKYLLERELARGGMGTLWVALDTQLRRRVALKRVGADVASSRLAFTRFEREAMAVARLSHPNVVQIHDYGFDGEAPFIVMELLEGEDLSERLGRAGRLSLAALIPIITQACKALSAAHAANIVHRDLKPANIFLARSVEEDRVKVLDFGIAALGPEPGAGGEASFVEGGVVGTPPYMSPEHARGRAVDHRSDLWSLGVVAYQALTGRLPFDSPSLGDLLAAICMDPIAPPSSIVSDLPAEVDWFFQRALARAPSERFQSAEEMGNACAALTQASTGQRAVKVLFVDDEPDMPVLVAQRLRSQVRSGSIELHFAADGEDALDKMRHHPDIDIVVTDIRMPKMDGLTLLERVCKINPIASVIMMTAFGDMSNVRRAMNHGAFDFVVKPIDFKDLQATLVRAVSHVGEARTRLRSVEENDALRQFVHRGVLDDFVPSSRRAAVLSGQEVEGTFAFIDICPLTTALSAARTADAVEVLNICLEAVAAAVTLRGGMIEKFVGDGILAAFFGEDHGSRAVAACFAVRGAVERAAVQAATRWPSPLGVRIGVESGKAVRAAVGAKSVRRLDLAIIGEPLRAASSLEHSAASGQILVGPVLRTAAERAFDLAPHPLPGKDAPAFEVVSARPTAEVAVLSMKTTVGWGDGENSL